MATLQFSKKSIVLAVTAVAATSVVASGGMAVASGKIGPGAIKNDAVRSKHIKDGTIKDKDLSASIRKQLAKAGTPGPKGATGATGAKGAPGAPGPKGDAGKDGVGIVVNKTFESKAIDKIGGPFKSNATKVGSFTLDKGTYVVWTNAFFDDHNNKATAATPQLQAAVRAGEASGVNDGWGLDLGTILTSNFPADTSAHDQEINGASMKVVTIDADDTQVNVYGFGYNDDRSGNGGGDFNVTIDVAVTPVG